MLITPASTVPSAQLVMVSPSEFISGNMDWGGTDAALASPPNPKTAKILGKARVLAQQTNFFLFGGSDRFCPTPLAMIEPYENTNHDGPFTKNGEFIAGRN